MKNINFLILSGLLFAGSLHASSLDDRFNFNVVYLFNIVSDARNFNTDVTDNGGIAAYIGYDILPWLSVEAGGVDFDTINMRQNTGSYVQQTGYNVSGFTLGLKGETSFAGLFDVWADIGLYSWKSNYNYQVEYPDFPVVRVADDGSNSSQDTYVRLGVTLPMTDNITATIESSYYEFKNLFYDADDKSTDYSHHCIGLGLEYNF
ncbi:MAG: outer membrane beta-barrel protein [Gammaproteobacteria bacterium]|nr:outer membrane beta-barrel protein [Gammaproteobacteria bacterium]